MTETELLKMVEESLDKITAMLAVVKAATDEELALWRRTDVQVASFSSTNWTAHQAIEDEQVRRRGVTGLFTQVGQKR